MACLSPSSFALGASADRRERGWPEAGRGGKELTLAQLALKFCLSHPAVSTVIPGMRTIAHVEDDCTASDGKLLTKAELAELKKQAWSRNFYPQYG